MIQEDKQLLLKDLCARLPYSITVCDKNNPTSVGKLVSLNMQYKLATFEVDNQTGELYTCPIEFVAPYLRPMSSMTDEEKMFVNGLIYNKDSIWLSPLPTWVINESDVEKYIDFCHKRHLDWRGLIEKGLAIGTINGIYN